MNSFLVCNKWNMTICNELLGINSEELQTFADKNTEFMPYSHAVLRRMPDMAKGAWCYEAAANYLVGCDADIKTITEYFGGLGRASIIVNMALKPIKHVIYELDEGCLSNIRQQNLRNALMYRLDSRRPDVIVESDLSCLDFNSMTITKLIREDWLGWLTKVMSCSNYVLLTDTAVSRLHLHLDSYSRDLGVSVTTTQQYIDALSKFINNLCGMGVIASWGHTHASYMLFGRQCGIRDAHILAPKEARNYFRLLR